MDNSLSDQLKDVVNLLSKNKKYSKYSETMDRLFPMSNSLVDHYSNKRSKSNNMNSCIS